MPSAETNNKYYYGTSAVADEYISRLYESPATKQDEASISPTEKPMPASREEGIDEIRTLWYQINILDNAGHKDTTECRAFRQRVYSIQNAFGISDDEVFEQ